jgi:preprotein translocase subunit SecE
MDLRHVRRRSNGPREKWSRSSGRIRDAEAGKARRAAYCFAVWRLFLKQVEHEKMAKTSAVEFFNQVKTEAGKIVWPTRRETMMTAVMVVIMTSILGLFFFGIDTIFGAIVKWLLTFAAGQA